MAILKNVGLKTSTIDEIKDNFDGAQGVVVVNYSGLTENRIHSFVSS